MARPKSNLPRKQHLNLSVDAQARENLIFISAYHQKSMSLIISEWAAKEAARIAKKMGVSAPNVNQISLENIIAAPLQPEPQSRLDADKKPEPQSRLDADKQPEPQSRLDADKKPEPQSRLDADKKPEPRSLSGAIRKLMDKK